MQANQEKATGAAASPESRKDPKVEIVDGVEVVDETGGSDEDAEAHKGAKPRKATTKGAKTATTSRTTPKSGKKATKKKGTNTRARGAKKTATGGASGDTKGTAMATGKKKTTKKASKGKKPGGDLTIASLAEAYLAHLAEIGKGESTVRSYRNDLRVAERELGAETTVESLTPSRVGRYFASDAVTKNRKGKPRSEITIRKVCRVFRMALDWAAETGVIDEAPIPASEAAHARKKKATEKTDPDS